MGGAALFPGKVEFMSGSIFSSCLGHPIGVRGSSQHVVGGTPDGGDSCVLLLAGFDPVGSGATGLLEPVEVQGGCTCEVGGAAAEAGPVGVRGSSTCEVGGAAAEGGPVGVWRRVQCEVGGTASTNSSGLT